MSKEQLDQSWDVLRRQESLRSSGKNGGKTGLRP